VRGFRERVGSAHVGRRLPDRRRNRRRLKGPNPRDLPISLPTKFELVINLSTAKTLGVDVPMSLVVRSDEMLD
jgi:putative ABC transport system substrate-binding protein